MNTALLSIKLEPELKKEVQIVAAQLGVSLSTVVKAKLKEFVRTKSLNISLNETPSTELINIFQESDKEIKSPAFDNAEDALNWLKVNNAD